MSADAAFWLYNGPNMVISILLYTLIGRYMLSLFFRPQSELVIWRVFCQVTDPVLHAVRAITPRIVAPGLVMIFAVFWLIILRILWLLIAVMYGFLPQVGAQ
ncbi:MAG: YggT family protein [Methylobacterium sp.]|nr:MAG: YggT family protein [Methylobacterium sp.]